MARGRHLLLLNSDAWVRPGWLEPLLQLIDGDDGVSAVAPKLLYPDGRLQEAGSILWRDARVRQYGDGDVPNRPEYNFRRTVDYASAACLLVRRSAFIAVGGFDPRFRAGLLRGRRSLPRARRGTGTRCLSAAIGGRTRAWGLEHAVVSTASVSSATDACSARAGGRCSIAALPRAGGWSRARSSGGVTRSHASESCVLTGPRPEPRRDRRSSAASTPWSMPPRGDGPEHGGRSPRSMASR